jgi:hypothetical protein
MKKIAFIIGFLSVIGLASTPQFDIEFSCFENNTLQNCTTRKTVNLSTFDSSVENLNSNYYDLIEESDFNLGVFYDDDNYGFDKTTDKFYAKFKSLFLFKNNSRKLAYYGDIDSVDQLVFSDSEKNNVSSFESSATLVYKIYNITNENITYKNTDDEFTLTSDRTLPAIQLGTRNDRCIVNQTGKLIDDESAEFSVKFDECPVIVTAVSDNDTVYQYTANFKKKSTSFVWNHSTNQDITNGAIETELLNSSGAQIGYLQYDLFNNSYKIIDNNRQPFTADS